MATLTGKGAMTDVNLLVIDPGHTFKDKTKPDSDEIKGRYLTVQVDQSMMNPEQIAQKGTTRNGIAAQTNPYLASENKVDKHGNPYVEHSTSYAESQFAKIVAAANAVGKGQRPKVTEAEMYKQNGEPVLNQDGTPKMATVYAIKASVMANSKGQLIINTARPMAPNTGNTSFGKSVLERQNKVTNAARTYREAHRPAKSAQQSAQAAKPESTRALPQTPAAQEAGFDAGVEMS